MLLIAQPSATQSDAAFLHQPANIPTRSVGYARDTRGILCGQRPNKAGRKRCQFHCTAANSRLGNANAKSTALFGRLLSKGTTQCIRGASALGAQAWDGKPLGSGGLHRQQHQ